MGSERRARWPALMVLFMFAAGGVATASAQSAARDGGLVPPMRVQAPLPVPEASLTAPAVILAAPASEVALGLRLADGVAPPANSFVRIRGLPPTAALSEGHAISPGAWAVPLAALDTLKLIIPAGLAGKREITVALVTTEGRILHETKVALVVAAAGLITPEARPPQATTMPPPRPAPEATPPVPPVPPAIAERPTPAPPALPPAAALPKPPAPPQPAIAKEPQPTPALNPDVIKRAQGYLDRGLTLMKGGDIASARLFLQRAAEEGLAAAALALGATFDAVELSQMRAHGIRPDPAEARRWYERAAELGSGEAVQRLKRVEAR